MNSRIITDYNEWNRVLEGFDRIGLNDVYFQPEYAALYAGQDASPEAYVFEADGETFFLPWILRPVHCPALSKPVFDVESPYGYGGPISTSGDESFLEEAWTALREVSLERGVICGFFRLHPLLNNHEFCHPVFVDVVSDRQTVILTLNKDADLVWRQYSSGTRGKVRKAQKLGVDVAARTDAEALSQFADLYEAHMRELSAHDDYYFGESYFRMLPKLGDGAYRVYLAIHKEQLLGGAIVLFSKRWAHYHLSASLREFTAFAPNNILRHAVISELLNDRWEKLHFGGGLSADPQDGLFRFKAGYSPERATFRLGKYMVDKESYDFICSWWAERNPHLIERFGNRFQKYRYK